MTREEAPTPAAGLILVRGASELEVLMTERHRALDFAGGALVFPGGRLDPADHDAAWRDRSDGWDDLPEALRPAAIAAVRETFEEAGLLLARDRKGAFCDGARLADIRRRWRGPLARSNAAFLSMLGEEALRPALDALVVFAHWIAPPGLHRRFDTRFFAAHCPPDQSALADGGEATEAVWVRPRAALADAEAGRRRLIFPTRRKLEMLALSADAEEALAAARARPAPPIMPALVERDGARWLTIPTDLGYPVTEESLETSMRG